MVGSRLKCERCRDELESRPRIATAAVSRVRLMRGPDGERLCRRHHVQAWDEEMRGEESNAGGSSE